MFKNLSISHLNFLKEEWKFTRNLGRIQSFMVPQKSCYSDPLEDLELSEKLKFFSEFFMVWSSF